MSTTRRDRPVRSSAARAPAASEEQAFLAIGPAAERWLIRAAGVGAQRIRRKMAEAVDLAKLHGPDEVDHALGACAQAGRFADGDLAAALAPPAGQKGRADPVPRLP